MVEAGLPGWFARNVFDGLAYSFTESNTVWNKITAPKSCALVAVNLTTGARDTSALFNYRPINPPPSARSVYGISSQGAAVLPLDGEWYVRLVESTGGPQARTLFLVDFAMVLGTADVSGGFTSIDLATIAGTPQTPLDLTGKFAPRVLAGNDPDSVSVDDDNTVIRVAALVGRKFLYLRNTGLNACGLAFATAKADPAKGIILNPDEVMPADALNGITEEAIYAACDTGLVTTLSVQQGL